ncbi:glycine cleavage system protein R [Reinekea marina]|uniref:Glycine cleavage system transcriptional repressor n=2 Tax=Reinekea marina TaxID=1310421 RepID=A0ABV7WV00_9GAMM
MEFILTIMANDRTGIAERLAREIAAHQGNWLESRLATMAGKFAGIVRVEVPEANFEALSLALQNLKEDGLNVSIEMGETGEGHNTGHVIEVVGNDRPGIVREVTDALAGQHANVIDLQTKIAPASMSGGVIFKAMIEFALTDEQSLDNVIQALENLSPDLMVDTK